MKQLYKIFLFLFAVSILMPGVKITDAAAKTTAKQRTIKVNVQGANIKLKKGRKDSIETKYYGKASDANYKLKTSADGNKFYITLKYTGSGMAPTIEEGGVIVKIPDGIFPLLCIRGKSAGIVMNNIQADTDLLTEHCAVAINNKHSKNKIHIHSAHDSYEIQSVPISEDFYLKAVGSVVQYSFTEQPQNLKFKLADGYPELPDGWKKNFSIGLGRPNMTVDVKSGIFELSVG